MSDIYTGFVYICGNHVKLSDVSQYHYLWDRDGDGGYYIVLTVAGSTLRIRADDAQEANACVLALTMLIGGAPDVLELAGLDE